MAPILDRNMFCSACLPVVEKPDESESSSPVATSLPLTLLATIVSPKDPTWSMAAIRDNNTRDSALYRLGQEVPGAAVDGIEDTRVYLKVGGHIEYLDLLAAAQPAEKSHDMSIGGGDPHGILADLDRGVRKLSETEYQLDRKLLDKVLGNTQMLATSARIVPAIKDGKPNGFKLYAIRPNSVYGRIGLQNGDTVHAINGHEISTPDAALSVYQKVKSASHISVSLTRRGQTTTLDYTVR